MFRRFNPRHALFVHGLKKAGAKDWFAWQLGNVSYAPPRLACVPSPWAHERSRTWQLCQSHTPCDDDGVVLSPTREQLRNMSVPWLPVAVRNVCVKRLKGVVAG